MTGDAADCGGTGSASTSEAASGEGDTSAAIGVVEAGTDVEVVGEVGEGSFFANDFFSLARLFWNHTFPRETKKKESKRGVFFLTRGRGKKWGVVKRKRGRVPGPPWETS